MYIRDHIIIVFKSNIGLKGVYIVKLGDGVVGHSENIHHALVAASCCQISRGNGKLQAMLQCPPPEGVLSLYLPLDLL